MSHSCGNWVGQQPTDDDPVYIQEQGQPALIICSYPLREYLQKSTEKPDHGQPSLTKAACRVRRWRWQA
jgi:hypothetical protein